MRRTSEPFRFATTLSEAFMRPRLRALLPKGTRLAVDGKSLFLSKRNPTPQDLARFRAFFLAAFPHMYERPDHVVYYDNKPDSKRTI